MLSVPCVTVVVIITSKEHLTSAREINGRDTAQDFVVGKVVDLTVGAQVKEAARRIIGTGSKGISYEKKRERGK